MVLQQASTAVRTGTGLPVPIGVRLSSVTGQVFTERTESLVGCTAGLMEGALSSHRLPVEAEVLLARRGNSFITMSERLLGELPGPCPELDAVFLAYGSPDLFTHDVAGCYLAERLPGSPTPLAVADQGVGAPFTALRLADAMTRSGELVQGALFVYDQNATGWHHFGDREPWSADDRDAAVLVRLGTGDGARVQQIRAEAAVDPARAVRDLLDRFPALPVYAGGALLSHAAGLGEEHTARLAGPPTGHDCTGAWSALADHWPVARPVVVADYDTTARRLYSCLLVPDPAEGVA